MALVDPGKRRVARGRGGAKKIRPGATGIVFKFNILLDFREDSREYIDMI